jgi:hypothetical protein
MTKNEITSYEVLNTCPIGVGNVCQVIGGYAESVHDLITNFPQSYHRIPVGTEVVVVDANVDFITISAQTITLDGIIVATLKQVLERRDLLYISSNNN